MAELINPALATSLAGVIVAAMEGAIADSATASMAKWWITDMQQQVVDECDQIPVTNST